VKVKYTIEPVRNDEGGNTWYAVRKGRGPKQYIGPFDYGTQAADAVYEANGKIVGNMLPYGGGSRKNKS